MNVLFQKISFLTHIRRNLQANQIFFLSFIMDSTPSWVNQLASILNQLDQYHSQFSTIDVGRSWTSNSKKYDFLKGVKCAGFTNGGEGSYILLALRCIQDCVLFFRSREKQRDGFLKIQGKECRFYKYPRKIMIKQVILL